VLVAAHAASGFVASLNPGKPGEPIRLVAGFNPYFAPAWTLAIIYHKALWKKHLPRDSQVDSFPHTPSTQLAEGKYA